MSNNRSVFLAAAVLAAALIGTLFWWSGSPRQLAGQSGKALQTASVDRSEPVRVPLPADKAHLRVATFAGGCFWCIEEAFERVPEGVYEVVSGYTGGVEKDPGYYDVAKGRTGHTEAVQLYYDPKLITYEGLLQVLFRSADPTDATGQYYDRGHQYRPGIYYHDDEQRRIAMAFRKRIDESGQYPRPVVIEIEPHTGFYMAEELHQDYAVKNPIHYLFYTHGSGRVAYQEKIWGDELEIDFSKFRPQPEEPASEPEAKLSDSSDDMPMAEDMIVPASNDAGTDNAAPKEKKMSYKKPPQEEIKKRLTPLQFKVTQHEGTERPFQNEYWDNKRDGIYVDIVSGEPLFSSKDKYKSGTGWPSFTRPLEKENIVEKVDRKLFATRTEIRSKHGDSHLGHVFEDGPKPTGLRYCMNSASMRFIPKEDLEKEGYGDYLRLFDGE